ncbi:hypothetical protein NPIL_547841 [Nephila pilipes]|uniref:Uncharacterized protein n=1 Tax=Nephila pilipes TaxID=299642 RepID=A0A8X6PUN1_NEPPI|nr:hypothetical protein NPIL_547841 [Nephila pilipes]
MGGGSPARALIKGPTGSRRSLAHQLEDPLPLLVLKENARVGALFLCSPHLGLSAVEIGGGGDHPLLFHSNLLFKYLDHSKSSRPGVEHPNDSPPPLLVFHDPEKMFFKEESDPICVTVILPPPLSSLEEPSVGRLQ